MFGSEIKESTYLAVSVLLLSLVLGMVSFVISVRSDIAEARNTEIRSSNILRIHREFNRFNNRVVFGESVIEAILYYAHSGIEIAVDNSGGGVSNFHINRQIALANPSFTDLAWLLPRFPPNARFRAFLVYDGTDPRPITTVQDSVRRSSDVTGIKFVNTGTR